MTNFQTLDTILPFLKKVEEKTSQRKQLPKKTQNAFNSVKAAVEKFDKLSQGELNQLKQQCCCLSRKLDIDLSVKFVLGEDPSTLSQQLSDLQEQLSENRGQDVKVDFSFKNELDTRQIAEFERVLSLLGKSTFHFSSISAQIAPLLARLPTIRIKAASISDVETSIKSFKNCKVVSKLIISISAPGESIAPETTEILSQHIRKQGNTVIILASFLVIKMFVEFRDILRPACKNVRDDVDQRKKLL